MAIRKKISQIPSYYFNLTGAYDFNLIRDDSDLLSTYLIKLDKFNTVNALKISTELDNIEKLLALVKFLKNKQELKKLKLFHNQKRNVEFSYPVQRAAHPEITPLIKSLPKSITDLTLVNVDINDTDRQPFFSELKLSSIKFINVKYNSLNEDNFKKWISENQNLQSIYLDDSLSFRFPIGEHVRSHNHTMKFENKVDRLIRFVFDNQKRYNNDFGGYTKVSLTKFKNRNRAKNRCVWR